MKKTTIKFFLLTHTSSKLELGYEFWKVEAKLKINVVVYATHEEW